MHKVRFARDRGRLIDSWGYERAFLSLVRYLKGVKMQTIHCAKITDPNERKGHRAGPKMFMTAEVKCYYAVACK